jgi:hypothetical protein
VCQYPSIPSLVYEWWRMSRMGLLVVGFILRGFGAKNIQISKRRFWYEVTGRDILFCGRNCAFCKLDV